MNHRAETTAVAAKQVNYVLLDLDKGSDSTSTSVPTHATSPQGSLASFLDSPDKQQRAMNHQSMANHAATNNMMSIMSMNVSSTGQAAAGPATAGAAAAAATSPAATTNAEGYATIDFDRTAALSNTVASSVTSDQEEGLRKTRHNSTIANPNSRLITFNRQPSASVSD